MRRSSSSFFCFSFLENSRVQRNPVSQQSIQGLDTEIVDYKQIGNGNARSHQYKTIIIQLHSIILKNCFELKKVFDAIDQTVGAAVGRSNRRGGSTKFPRVDCTPGMRRPAKGIRDFNLLSLC